MPRKKPFSGKQKKHQLQEKRDRKRPDRPDGHHRPPHGPHAGMGHRSRQQSQELLSSEDRNSTSEGEMPEVNVLNQQPNQGMGLDSQYDPNRYHLHFQKDSKSELASRKKRAMQPYDPLPESALEVDIDDIYQPGSVLDMPKRPSWDYNVGKDKLEHREEQEFRNYLQTIYEKFPSKKLSYFEINLETWRQLWRVLEMSDIVLLITDIRHPALHFSPALYDYVTRDLKKHLILVLNKIDLAPPPVVVAWRSYLKEKFPQLQVICFTSFPRESQTPEGGISGVSGFKRKKRGKFTAVGPMQLLQACEMVTRGNVELNSWREKIEADMRGEDSLASQVIASNTEEMTMYEEHEAFKDGIITIGCVGHPNVGKSSVMNGLCGRKVVSASRTPGHTKHFQTIFLTPTVKLCDSPGLTFPSLVDKQFQILSGIYPVAQVQEPYTAVGYLAQRIPLTQILRIRHPEADGSPEGASGAHWTAFDICEAWAEKRGFITAKAARKDTYRAANNILRMAVDGRLCMCMTPPGYTAQKEFWEQHQETLEIGRLQDQHRRVEEDLDREGDKEDDLSDQFTSSGEDSDADVESNDVDRESDSRRKERRRKGNSSMATTNPFDLLMDA
ncbi:guanine nucleotide-binding protein-like 1 [Strongylocentrotus purpuratus]|uniref:Guanine nucleotide-binding protein-like 1 n=1 Tax=Strongylocentrotus purpuratus TaxID=7668 RepID=A0A7M7HIL9_STRPU|nr:guanine nucleotide-binding protein-like 1 [Strongylocentrotus purpuratus]